MNFKKGEGKYFLSDLSRTDNEAILPILSIYIELEYKKYQDYMLFCDNNILNHKNCISNNPVQTKSFKMHKIPFPQFNGLLVIN